MCAAVVATYWPPMVGDVPRGVKVVLGGSDFQNLHSRRLRYAQDALFGPLHALPGWYPPELGGKVHRRGKHRAIGIHPNEPRRDPDGAGW